jgi:ferritin-like metal-binding protein YciE
MATSNVDPGIGASKELYTKSELEEILARATRAEKDKLYQDLDRHRREAEEARKKLEDLQKSSKNGVSQESVDLKAEIAALNTQIGTMQGKMETVINTALDSANTNFQKQLEAQRLTTLRETLIDAHKDAIIPELVTGATEQEIRASLERAKQRFKEIVDPKVAAAKLEAGKGKLPGAVDTGNRGGGAADATTGTAATAEDLRHLSGPDWVKQREDWKRKAFEEAGISMKVNRG